MLDDVAGDILKEALRRKDLEGRRLRALLLYRAGYTAKYISECLGLSTSSLYRYLREEGIPFRQPRRQKPKGRRAWVEVHP